MHIFKVDVEKSQLKVESTTSGTRWRQMVAPEWYNYGVLVCPNPKIIYLIFILFKSL